LPALAVADASLRDALNVDQPAQMAIYILLMSFTEHHTFREEQLIGEVKFATICTFAVLAMGAGAANAQNANDRPGMTAPQPDGSMAAPRSNPQSVPQTSGRANPGSTKSMDEQAGGNSGAVERNPSGAPIGSKANPSPR
jgi:hypothetical protein